MAKVLATVGGVALKPGVSLNRRWYTREMIADTVANTQARIARGESMDIVRRDEDDGISQRTHHEAGDDSTRLIGRLTGVSLDEDGNARFTAAIADTPHGRTIASLLDTSDGQPAFLRGVSIRGYWKGTVRKVKGPDGRDAEQGSGLSLEGLDYTRTPGVPGAQVDTFAWSGRPGYESQTTERVAITESVQEASVTITEETAPGQQGLPVGLAEMLALPPHVLENGVCATCAQIAEGGDAPGDGGKPFGSVVYADPGYQADKQKRYPVDTAKHVKAALAYLAQKSNAAKYTSTQLKRVKSRIMAAAKKFGITVSAESAGWTFDAPAQVSEALAEHMGMPSCAGSWSVRASNGPVDICLSSYSVDPEDLDVILRAAADAACKALAALDPDMDGDVDLPGVGDNSDPDGDAGSESAPEGEQETESQAAAPAAATTETEGSMTETTTTGAEAAPGIDPKILAEAVAGILGAQAQEKAQRKAEKRAAREAAESAAAQAQAAANAAATAGTTATASTATETDEQRRARLQKLVDEQFAAAAAAEGLAATETDEQIIAKMLEERMIPLRQARAEGGGVQRKGIAQLEAIADAPGISKKLSEATNEELTAMAGAAYGPHSATR